MFSEQFNDMNVHIYEKARFREYIGNCETVTLCDTYIHFIGFAIAYSEI